MLELNGAYEVSFGMELPVDPSRAGFVQVAGFTYEIDLNEGTYTLTEMGPLDVIAGPVGLSSTGLGTYKLNSGAAGAVTVSPGVKGAGTTVTRTANGSEAGSCGDHWTIFLWAQTRTEDIPGINLAETEQQAIWGSDYCQNRLGVSRI